MNLGSTTLPMTTFTTRKTPAVAMALIGPNCMIASNTGGMAAMTLPMLGT